MGAVMLEGKRTIQLEGQEVDAREVFCLAWPVAERAIQALIALAPGVPGVGWMVALGSEIILVAGKKTYELLGCYAGPMDQTQASHDQRSAAPYMR